MLKDYTTVPAVVVKTLWRRFLRTRESEAGSAGLAPTREERLAVSVPPTRPVPPSPPPEDAGSPFRDIRRLLANRPRRVIDPPQMRPAAVLVPLFEAEGETHILFTLRTDTVTHHKGQVAFPGGGRHAADRDLLETALREAHEEIGLHPRQVEILGALDDVLTISSFQVTPWVGRIEWPVELVGSERETADIFTVALSRLLDPALCSVEERVYEGRRYYPLHRFSGGRHPIWGITGHILASFLEIAYGWRHPEIDATRVNLLHNH